MSEADDAQALAERAAAAMWSRDAASQALGMEIEEIAPGRARLSMRVRADMTNGHGLCHGGLIFALADSAFAFACNARGQSTVAQHCAISYLHPAREGDRLVATAEECALEGRSGVYDIAVRDGAGGLIALFRGQSRTIAGSVFDSEPKNG